MAEITAALVKELRERTGAGMMDCKKALAEVGADLEKGVEWLRKKGLAAAQKKSGRIAAEGLVGLAAAGNAAVVVEVNAETDFVSRNERFQGFVRGVAGLALGAKGDLEAVKGQPFPGAGRNVADELTNMVATIGENMNLRRALYLAVDQGTVATYLHNAIGPGLGKIGVLVALKSAGKAEKLAEVGKQIAMHIAAAAPRARTVAELDPALVEKERNILTEQAQTSGRPADVIAKMVEGRVRKFYEDVVLTEQLFVIDGKTKISAVLAAAGKEAGAPIEIAGFVRYQLGEGLEKKQEDFAQAVADQLKR